MGPSPSEKAKAFISALQSEGITPYIANVSCRLDECRVADELLPLTVNDGNVEGCFVSSPYGQYILYGQDTLQKRGKFASFFFSPLASLLKWAKFNRHISVNNWLMTTNLYPSLNFDNVKGLTKELSQKYPDHMLQFRSLSRHTQSFLVEDLQKLGWNMVASRIIYLFDPLDPKAFSSRMYKSDLKLLEKSSYEKTSVTEEDAPRIKELYDALYLEKYSKQNVQWTEKFFRLAIREKLLEIIALRKDGRIDAVAGYVIRGGVMTAPLFGYDQSVSQEEGLYRLISLLIALEAKEKGVLLNQSSGAGSFKMLRRAKPVLEWSAVYTEHLKGRQKWVWKAFIPLINKVGIPVMRRLEGVGSVD